MTKLYKSKLATEPHVVSAYKLRDFLSAKEPINETGKSYAYVCQRQIIAYPARLSTKPSIGFTLKDPLVSYTDDTYYEPFIMSENIFAEAYDEL